MSDSLKISRALKSLVLVSFLGHFSTAQDISSTDAPAPSNDESALPNNYASVRKAHAIVGPLAYVVLFPFGAIAIRTLSLSGIVYLHAGWMLFTYMLVIVSAGMGIWMALVSQQLDTYHCIIGLVILGALVLQPVSGLTHHLLYKKHAGVNKATYPHIWWGRAIITLGFINGGFGLQLSGNTTKGEIAYGAMAGGMWCLWMAIIVIAYIRARWRKETNTAEEVKIEGKELYCLPNCPGTRP